MTLWQVDLIPWVVLAVYFVANAVRVKPTRTEQSRAGRFWHVGLLVVACFLIFSRATGVGWLDRRFMPEAPEAAYVGIALTTLGVAGAIWARAILGANWSAEVALKVDHTLIVKGPYAYVRHPLYTGVLLGGLGTVLVAGEWKAILGFVSAVIGLSVKARNEEAMLRTEFPMEYEQYRRKTGFLLPGFRSVS